MLTSILVSVVLIGTLLAFNTSVFAGGDHGHDAHGAPAAPIPDAIGDWSPWSIVFRLAASVAACSFAIGLSLVSTDASQPLLWIERATLGGHALRGLVVGVATMGLLVVAQVAMNAQAGLKR